MRLIQFLVAVLVLGLAAAPLPAVLTDVTLSFNPAAPTSSQSIAVALSATSVNSAIFEGVTVGSDTITIKIDDQCRGFCVPETLSLLFNIDPLPAGAYDVQVVNAFDTEVFSTELTVFSAPQVSAESTVRSWPQAPGDNDAVQILASAVTCGDLELLSAGLEDDLITVRGRLQSSGACLLSPPQVQNRVDALGVGTLEPGDYRIHLLLQDQTVSGSDFALAATSRLEVTDAPDRADLRGGRFQVTVAWDDGQGNAGVGRPVPGASESTSLFSFFSRDNWELMVKVLDACALNDRFWVFTAASTDVEYTVEVLDTETGDRRTYRNELGNQAPAVPATDAFATCR